MSDRIAVWDPNPFNPYGVEVARVISESSEHVRRFGRRGQRIASDNFTSTALLPPAAAGSRSVSLRVRYLLALVGFSLYVLVRRPLVVVCWMNTEAEQTMIRTLQRLRCRTLVVVHNPIAGRDEADDYPLTRAIRSAATAVLIHDDVLRGGLPGYENIVVAAHPAYLAWAASTADWCAADRTAGLSALYLGSARVDKGFDLVPRLAGDLRRHDCELACAIGRLTADENLLLERADNVTVLTQVGVHMSDPDVRRYMETSSVLVAPYRDVTASGTVLMALTVGLPVAAFESPVLLGTLDAENMAPVGDTRKLAERAVASSRTDRADLAARARRHDDLAQVQWSEAVRRVLGNEQSVEESRA
ncbi:hypothetical protein ABH922_003713 [Rhodococcus sp. 27YEA15]|uniref:glycosyltransferase n=1 Tax=Rhodococcus sp. 27YEA15 TaxID=3156259 RepID=UPI003C7B6323